MPLMPGAALLDELLHILEQELAIDPIEWQITAAKFLEPVRPGNVLTLEHNRDAHTIRFALRIGDRQALAGTLTRLQPGAVHDL